MNIVLAERKPGQSLSSWTEYLTKDHLIGDKM